MRFESTFLRELPVDPETGPRLRQVEKACASRVLPTPVSAPRLLAFSREMAEELGLSEADLRGPFEPVLGGNEVLEGMDPYAACYGGHQFGNWAGQLGDGRAITLTEVRTPSGQRLELQLKGAGRTPYSRRADGRAVMRSSVREFLCSEAMHHLGIPTTRALSLVQTGDQVERDMFYDGRPKFEPGAIVCRVAESFLRFGNFEIFASRGDEDTLRRLATYTIKHFFPELLSPGKSPGPDEFVRFYREVCVRTAALMVEWMRVGFVHGVMNTDNMSILGLTIDYGPYGWVEDFDPSFTPNTTDAHGRRYRFGAQPRVGEWNLAQLGNALYALVGSVEPLEEALGAYVEELDRRQREMMLKKLGLTRWDEDEDRFLSEEVFVLLSMVETDMTIFFRKLADIDFDPSLSPQERRAPLEPAYYSPLLREPDYFKTLDRFLDRLGARVVRDLAESGRSPEERRQAMRRSNPKYIFRNYMAQLAIDRAETGDPSLVQELLELLRRPYDEQPEHEEWAARRPDWARNRAGCSMLSCSS